MATEFLYAGFWKRLAAFLIDSVLFNGVTLGFVAVVGFMYGALTTWPIRYEGPVRIFVDIALFILAWLYFSLLESSPLQATIGKMILGIKVTDLEGGRISFGRATGRHFAKMVSNLTLLIGYVMAGFTEKKQALHDMLAGTIVVNKKPYKS